MGDGANIENIQSAFESDTEVYQAETVEPTQTDYSQQLTIISQQQQVSIGVSCVLLGVLIVSMIFTILSRYI